MMGSIVTCTQNADTALAEQLCDSEERRMFSKHFAMQQQRPSNGWEKMNDCVNTRKTQLGIGHRDADVQRASGNGMRMEQS